MPSFGIELKPISIVAFLLTCLGCLLAIVAISMTSWWSLDKFGVRTYHGVWRLHDCVNEGNCKPGSATQLEAGQEAFFVSKVFATFTVFLSVLAVVFQIIYAITRLPAIRTATIFMLGSAAMFGLLAVFVFLGFYNTVKDGSPSIGAAFYLFLFATIICGVATAFTILASVRKASDNRIPAADDN